MKRCIRQVSTLTGSHLSSSRNSGISPKFHFDPCIGYNSPPTHCIGPYCTWRENKTITLRRPPLLLMGNMKSARPRAADSRVLVLDGRKGNEVHGAGATRRHASSASATRGRNGRARRKRQRARRSTEQQLRSPRRCIRFCTGTRRTAAAPRAASRTASPPSEQRRQQIGIRPSGTDALSRRLHSALARSFAWYSVLLLRDDEKQYPTLCRVSIVAPLFNATTAHARRGWTRTKFHPGELRLNPVTKNRLLTRPPPSKL